MEVVSRLRAEPHEGVVCCSAAASSQRPSKVDSAGEAIAKSIAANAALGAVRVSARQIAEAGMFFYAFGAHFELLSIE